MRRPALPVLLMLFALPAACVAADARALIDESLRRHAEAPYVFEELTLVSSDSEGRFTVRTARHYSRVDGSGKRRLIVIDTPAEARGTAVLIVRAANGALRREVVLPALGPRLAGGQERALSGAGPLFDTDFTLADLEPENPAGRAYVSEADQDLERVPHHVVRAGARRLFLRKDNLFISRIDYADERGKAMRRQSFRDPQPDETGAWRAGMTLMENLRDGRRTLIKADRRVHSADYVPAGVFDLER